MQHPESTEQKIRRIFDDAYERFITFFDETADIPSWQHPLHFDVPCAGIDSAYDTFDFNLRKGPDGKIIVGQGVNRDAPDIEDQMYLSTFTLGEYSKEPLLEQLRTSGTKEMFYRRFLEMMDEIHHRG